MRSPAVQGPLKHTAPVSGVWVLCFPEPGLPESGPCSESFPPQGWLAPLRRSSLLSSDISAGPAAPAALRPVAQTTKRARQGAEGKRGSALPHTPVCAKPFHNVKWLGTRGDSGSRRPLCLNILGWGGRTKKSVLPGSVHRKSQGRATGLAPVPEPVHGRPGKWLRRLIVFLGTSLREEGVDDNALAKPGGQCACTCVSGVSPTLRLGLGTEL